MKSSLKIFESKGSASNAASIAAAAKTATTRLEVLDNLRKIDIQHQYDYVFCGMFCVRNHKYTIHSDRKGLLFTAIQQLHKFGSSDYLTGSKSPLLVYHLSGDPILEMHFGAPSFLHFTPSCVAVTLPSEILIGSLKRQEESARTVLGESTTTLRAFDVEGQFLFVAYPGGESFSGDTVHNVIMGTSKKQIASVNSSPGRSTLNFMGKVPVDVKSLLLATAIWLEMIERQKPLWRRRKKI